MEETAQSVQQMQYSIDDLKMLMTGSGTDDKAAKALESRVKSLETLMKSSGPKAKVALGEDES
jgi:hypothetical protein